MPRRSVFNVHNILLQMIKQDFILSSASADGHKRDNGRNGSGARRGRERHHVWEVRHAGLLGIKYEVAVRSDLVDAKLVKAEGEDEMACEEILRGIVEAAVLGCVHLLFLATARDSSNGWSSMLAWETTTTTFALWRHRAFCP